MSVSAAQAIAVPEDERVTATGTYDQLMEDSPAYRHLFAKQGSA